MKPGSDNEIAVIKLDDKKYIKTFANDNNNTNLKIFENVYVPTNNFIASEKKSSC